MIVIVPCCGESQRFNGAKKQFLRAPNGQLLPVFSASGIKGQRGTAYVFIFDEFYKNLQHIPPIDGRLTFLQKQTKSQVETIAEALRLIDAPEESIYIKDCDNYFDAYACPNTVTVKHIGNDNFKLHNKSFTLADADGKVIEIAERDRISEYINVGGYGFASASMFLHYSQGCNYITEVIANCIKDGITFNVSYCDNYIDYGEGDDYIEFMKKYKQ